MNIVDPVAVARLLKLSLHSLPLLAAGLFAASCGGSAPHAAQAAVHCDRHASPGHRSAQILVDSLKPGQTGCLRAGTYTGTGREGYVLRVARGGRKGSPITIASAPGGRARLHGIVYVLSGAHHVRLSRLDIDARHPRRPGRSQVGIQVLGNRVTLDNSDVTTNRRRSCVILYEGARRTRIANNVFHDCGDPSNKLFDHAIYVADAARSVIERNVFVRSAGWAVHLYPRARRTLVTGNLMWENGGGVVFGGEDGPAARRNLVADNVIGASRQRAEVTSSFGGRLGRGNLVRRNCLAPGIAPNDSERGFRMVDNRVASGPECLTAAAEQLVDRLAGVAPALVSRLQR